MAYSRTRPLLALVMAVILSALTMAAALGQGVTQRTTNQIDNVLIRKITPRTAIRIPLNSRFAYTMQINYELQSIPQARIVVKVLRAQRGSTRYVQLCRPLSRQIRRGEGAFIITTDPISLKLPPRTQTVNDIIWIWAHLYTPDGRELANSSSMNPLAGYLEIKDDGKEPREDSFTLVSITPDPEKTRTWKTGVATNFELLLNYSQKSVSIGYIDVMLRDEYEDVGMWYGVVIPLPRGHGQVKLRLGSILIPDKEQGRKMKVDIHYRIEPLGGTVDGLTRGPFLLKK